MTIIVYKKSNGKIVRVYKPLWEERAFWKDKDFVRGSGLRRREYAQELYQTDDIEITEDTVTKDRSINKKNGKKYKPFNRKAKIKEAVTRVFNNG